MNDENYEVQNCGITHSLYSVKNSLRLPFFGGCTTSQVIGGIFGVGLYTCTCVLSTWIWILCE